MKALHACLLICAALLAGCASQPLIQKPAEIPSAIPDPAPVVPPEASTPPPAPAVVFEPTEADTAEVRMLLDIVNQQDRVYRAAAPLLVNNAALCRQHARGLLGFRAKNRHSFGAALTDAASAGLGLDERLRVADVLPGSGAAAAGLRAGDVLLAAEGQPFPQGPRAENEAAGLLTPLIAGRKAIRLSVLRDNRAIDIRVPFTEACAFNIVVGNTDLVNAYGDGFRILVTRGMLQSVANDHELAYVLAKEMAHNMLGHAARMNQQATVGGIIDNLARLHPDHRTMVGSSGMRPLPPEFEVAADRLAVYLLARAGYPLDGLIPFWTSMAARYPEHVPNAYMAIHPGLEQRLDSLRQAVEDVRGKRTDGRPLIPAS